MAKILVVDDDNGLLRIIAEYLKAYSFETDLANSAPEARNCLENSNYDAVVSDFLMPGETGLDLLGYVSSLYPKVPFILMSGSSSSGIKYDAEKMGGSGYIEKPFLLRDLVETIRNVLSSGGRQLESADLPARSSQPQIQ